MDTDNKVFQIIWGIVLAVTGVLVILQIPEKFNQMGNIGPNNFFARSCFYGLGIFLFLGGVKKVIQNKPSFSDDA